MRLLRPAGIRNPSRRLARGFTLTEVALVMGIVAIVMAGIWIAYSTVQERGRISQANQDLAVISQKVRAAYASLNTVTTFGDQTAAFVTLGVFPESMRIDDNGYPMNPWGGRTIIAPVNGPNSGNAGPGFMVIFQNIPKSACVELMSYNTNTGGTVRSGAIGAKANARPFVAAPISPSAAGVECDKNDRTNILYISYLLKG